MKASKKLAKHFITRVELLATHKLGISKQTLNNNNNSMTTLGRLTTTNLPLRNRPHPCQAHVQRNNDAAHDPEDARILPRVVAEDNRKDDSTKVARRADNTRQDTVGVRVNVRHESKVGAIAGFHEDGHKGNKTDHGVEVVRVELADDNQEDTAHDADEVNPELLRPQAAVSVLVDQVADEAAKRAGDDVEETEHSCPAARLGLAQVWEVLEVVGSEDGVDGKLAAEGAEVTCAQHYGLRRGDDFQCLLEGGLHYNLVLHFINDLAIFRGGS